MINLFGDATWTQVLIVIGLGITHMIAIAAGTVVTFFATKSTGAGAPQSSLGKQVINNLESYMADVASKGLHNSILGNAANMSNANQAQTPPPPPVVAK